MTAELCTLLETLEREIASLSTHPVFVGLEESCPHLSRRGVLQALASSSDIGACLCEACVALPISSQVGELLKGYFASFGHAERYREREQASQLLCRIRTLAEQERADSKNRVRVFEILVACCALCAALVVL